MLAPLHRMISMCRRSNMLLFAHARQARRASHTVVAMDDGVELGSEDGNTLFFSHRWLRDNCRCASCLHPATRQRLFDTLTLKDTTLQPDIAATEKELHVEWKDEGGSHSSSFSLEFLQNTALGSSTLAQELPSARPLSLSNRCSLWSSRSMTSVPRLSVSSLRGENPKGALRTWIEHLDTHGFAIVEGLQGGIKETEDVARIIAPPMQTFFGTSWNILGGKEEQEDATGEAAAMEHQDTAYTNLPLRPHTDGTYFTHPPALQFFRIAERTGGGGDTILVDGFNIVKQLQKNSPSAYRLLSTLPILWHYIEEDVYMHALKPVVRFSEGHEMYAQSGGREMLQFSFNNDDRAPVHIPRHLDPLYYDALFAVLESIDDERNQVRFSLRPDELLCVMNWRVMHARTRFTGLRRLQGCYIGMNDYNSRLHTLLEDRVQWKGYRGRS